MSRYIKPLIVGFVVAAVIGGVLSFLVAAAGGSAGLLPMMIGAFFGIFVAYLMANLAGNRAGKAASDAQREAALTLTPDPGKAMVIIVRDGFVGMAAGLNISIDGRTAAQIKSPRFTAIPLEPGAHELGLGFGGLAAKQNRDLVEPFAVRAGEVVAWRASVSIGAVKNSISVERIDADGGLQNRLRALKMTAPEAIPGEA